VRGKSKNPVRDDDSVVRNVRQLWLALPETSERSSWGHPNFRAGKRTFATFESIKGEPSVAVRLGGAGVRRYARVKGAFLTPYGRGQWLSLKADRHLNWTFLEKLILEGYKSVALKRMLKALDNIAAAPANHAPGDR
jgi:hypothetical protein